VNLIDRWRRHRQHKQQRAETHWYPWTDSHQVHYDQPDEDREFHDALRRFLFGDTR